MTTINLALTGRAGAIRRGKGGDMTQCLEQCDCDVCRERERHNSFKRAFRIANLYEARKCKNRYYKRSRNAYQAHITGCTLDRYLKPCNQDTPVSHVLLSHIRYSAKLRSDRYYKATHAATLAQSSIDPFLKQRDGETTEGRL